jgi:uncharacterized BrkB/YihY/UPF0761 family membrane protein
MKRSPRSALISGRPASPGSIRSARQRRHQPDAIPRPQSGRNPEAPGRLLLARAEGVPREPGLLLAGAVAYYALLSIVPLLILIVIALSKFIDETELLETLRRYLEWVIPSQSVSIVRELSNFLDHRDFIGWILLLTMISSQLACLHGARECDVGDLPASRRGAQTPFPRVGVDALYLHPYTWSRLPADHAGLQQPRSDGRAQHPVPRLHLGPDPLSAVLLYLLGVLVEICVLTSVYLVMPVGRLSLRHALVGGVTATVLWELTRHLLVWYFARLSQVSVLYGSLTTAIVVLLTMEIGATLLLFGAQVISEYERVLAGTQEATPKPMRTDAVPDKPKPREPGAT